MTNDITARFIGDTTSLAKAGKDAESITTKIGGAFSKLGSKIGGEFGTILSDIGDGMESVGKTAHGFAPKITAAGGAIAGLGLALQVAGSSDAAASAQLSSAIQATGAATSDFTDQIEKTAHAQENFGHTADDTKLALAKLTEATNDPSKAIANMGLVANLAAAKHISLEEAAGMVAKILGGSGGRILKEYGITMKKGGDATANTQDALNSLASKLNGQAAAAVDSFTGKVEIFKAKAEDLVAVLGQKIAPVLEVAAGGMVSLGAVLEIIANRHALAAAAALTGAEAETAAAVAATADAAATTVLGTRTALLVAEVDAMVVAMDAEIVSVEAATAAVATAGTAATLTALDFGVLGVAALAATSANQSLAESAKKWDPYLKNSADKAAQSFGHLHDQTDEVTHSTSDMATWMYHATASMADQRAAAVALDAPYKKAAQDLSDYISKLEGATLAGYDAADSEKATIKTIKDLGKKHKETGADVESGMRAVLDTADKVKAKYSDVAQGDKAYRDELDKLRDKTKPGSPLRKALDGYLAQLDKAAGTFTATLDIKTAYGRVVAAGQGAANASKLKAHGAAGGFIGGSRAMASGGSFTVGEHGLEVADVSANGSVMLTPHSGSMGGSGASLVLHFHGPVIGGTPDAIARMLMGYVDEAVRKGTMRKPRFAT